MANESIHIQHFHGQYTLSKTHRSPQTLQHRLDHIAQTFLSSAWDTVLSASANPDEAYYFVDRLDVNLTLNSAITDDRTLAKAWAEALQQGIWQQIRQGSASAIVFQNRADYLASFIADLLRGQAWQQWYYQEFLPLRSHSQAQIILQVLTADADTGRDALLALTQRGSLELLLSHLDNNTLERLVTTCLVPPSPRVVLASTYGTWVQRLRSHLATISFSPTDSPARNLARLYLTLLRKHPELGPDVNLARFLQDLLRWSATLQSHSDLAEFLQQLTTEDWPALLRQRRYSPSWFTTLVREVSGATVAELLRALGTDTQSPSQRSTTTAPRCLFTPFGGVFLLLPSLLDLELPEFLADCAYPEPQTDSKLGLLLWVMALQWLGPAQVEVAAHDVALALLAGVAQPWERSHLMTYLAQIPADSHGALQSAFQAHAAAVLQKPFLIPLRRQGLELPSAHLDSLRLSVGTDPWLADEAFDIALGPLSGLVLAWFATRLGAFAGSSPDYLRRTVLQSEAEVEIFTDRVEVHFLTCPLQMVLRMAGYDHQTWTIPWWNERSLAFSFA
jgi:hypothetical protein